VSLTWTRPPPQENGGCTLSQHDKEHVDYTWDRSTPAQRKAQCAHFADGLSDAEMHDWRSAAEEYGLPATEEEEANFRARAEYLVAPTADEAVGDSAKLTSPLGLPQHLDEHRPERPVLLAVDQELGEAASVPPVDEVHALPPQDRLGASGRRDDGRLIQVQDDAEPVGPALATKPLGIPVYFRLRVSQVLGKAARLAGVPSARHHHPQEPGRRHRQPRPERSDSRSIPTSTARSTRSSSQSISSSAKARLCG
jgi:hypothetical protein